MSMLTGVASHSGRDTPAHGGVGAHGGGGGGGGEDDSGDLGCVHSEAGDVTRTLSSARESFVRCIDTHILPVYMSRMEALEVGIQRLHEQLERLQHNQALGDNDLRKRLQRIEKVLRFARGAVSGESALPSHDQ